MLNQDQVQALKSPFPPEALWRGTLAGSIVDGVRAMVGFDAITNLMFRSKRAIIIPNVIQRHPGPLS